MKPFVFGKTLIFLAVAVAAVAGTVGPAQAQPAPPPANSALPADIVPGSPLADVVKMVQAGVDVATIQSYIVNSQSPFNLDADKILFLKDEGVPSVLINAMLERDKILYASSVTPVTPPAAPAPPAPMVDTSTPDTAPPPEDVTINYFYDSLSPYGTWVDIGGYGRCWRPTTVIYDSSWRPYCDRGHWVYTDCGWYWDSDYAWGVAFHYGRWFHHAQYGWCWYPDTVWAPSWVTWRSGGEYCGWAPLPPFAVFTPGAGFYYRGVSVGLDFDFGLGADSFMFVTADHFCDRRPRNYCIQPQYVTQIYHQTTVINNYNLSGKNVVNRGIEVARINQAAHQNIAPVHVSELPNAGRQGWRGPGYQQTLQRNVVQTRNGNSGYTGNAGNNFNSGNAVRYQTPGQTTVQGSQNGGQQLGSSHPQYQYQQQTLQQQQHQQTFQPSSPPVYPQQTQTRQYNTYGSANNGAGQGSQYLEQQTRNYGSTASVGNPQHGSEQLQTREIVTPQPRAEVQQNYIESGSHNNNQVSSPAPSQTQSVTHNSGGGNGSGGSSGGGSGSGNGHGPNKQNQ